MIMYEGRAFCSSYIKAKYWLMTPKVNITTPKPRRLMPTSIPKPANGVPAVIQNPAKIKVSERAKKLTTIPNIAT